MTLIWVIPAAPLLGTLILGLAGSALGNRISGIIGVASISLAALTAICIGIGWIQHAPSGNILIQNMWSWIDLPGLKINFGLYLDPLSLLMVLVITLIGVLIHLFSTEYMAEEAGYSRYFAYLNLFVAAMLLLVLADDLLLLFVGWEGVGVCSYLLVGFWFTEPANGAAAQKSFIVTRIADIAMLAGLLMLSTQCGTLNIHDLMASAATLWPRGAPIVQIAATLLLIGGLGKSAQLPLHTWLPDAMAGPTPVSALIHAATMVTAGVYLVVRLHPLFLLSPLVMHGIAIGGATTLLIAAAAGLCQSDIKRALAYSTMSQIGYMFVALGVGAWSAAMFHFLTHAVFKALLFLSVGAVTMHLQDEQNIFAMGGLRQQLPLAFCSFVVGAASLAALPLVTAGFFSKEMILGALWATPSPALWVAGITGALLTATYSFRLVFTIFFGDINTSSFGTNRLPIRLPLVILTIAACSIGWLETPGFLGSNHLLATFLEPANGTVAGTTIPPLISLAGCLVPLAGVGIAWVLHRKGFWRAQAQNTSSPIAKFFTTAGEFDAVYRVLFIRPYLWLVELLRNDPVDQLAIWIEHAANMLHRRLRATQTGQLRRYATWMMAGAVATIAMLVFT